MIPSYLVPLILSVTPGIEVRGAVLYSKFAGLGLVSGYLLPILASTLIIPLVYVGVYYLLDLFMAFSLVRKIILKTRRKVSRYTEKYGFWGLLLFVAIPFPGSGLYTGSLGAAILGIRKRVAIPALLIGNLLAFFIVLGLAYFIGPL